MEKYKDRNGRYIKPGDVLIYDEGAGFGQSVEEVIVSDGEMATLMRVGDPKWTLIDSPEPMPMKYYKLYPEHSENVTRDAYVVDVSPEEAFTAEFAERVFRRTQGDQS